MENTPGSNEQGNTSQPKQSLLKPNNEQSTPNDKNNKATDKGDKALDKRLIIDQILKGKDDKLNIEDQLSKYPPLQLTGSFLDGSSEKDEANTSLNRFNSSYSFDNPNKLAKSSLYQGNYRSLSLEKGSKIPMYPYNGKSDRLIDKILFIGYEKKNLKILIDKKLLETKKKETTDTKQEDKEPKEAKKKDELFSEISKKSKGKEGKEGVDNREEFCLEEKPVVLSEVSSNYNNQTIDNETIIDLIFPKAPSIFNLDLQPDIKSEDIKNEGSSNIVFSFNIPLEGNSKTSNNFYTYVYYEVYFQSHYFMVPYAICFLSEYPYFMNYKSIAHQIKTNFMTPIPKELILYNVVNFIPAPINASIMLKIFSDQVSKKTQHFRQLSGYPLFQFNLMELFNILPTDIIIQIFFFTFLENDMIFLSENLEILNIIMYIFANLNYPLNDSTYFFHILSVSKDTFMQGTSPFVTKTFSSMFGINCSYDPKLNTISKKQEHFLVDLENKRFTYEYNFARQEIQEDAKNNNELLDYVKDSIKGFHKEEFLGKAIYELYESLESISKKVTHTNIGCSVVNPDFFKQSEEKEANLMEKNKQIQEHFYLFILKILLKFFPFYRVEAPKTNEDRFMIDYHEKHLASIKPIEGLFFRKFKDCSKFNTYIANFIQNNDSLDLFKIPLLFAEEFLNQLICIQGQGKPLSFANPFNTIDNFYNVVNKEFAISFNFDDFYHIINTKNNQQMLEGQNVLELLQYSRTVQELKKKKNNDKMKEVDHQTFFKYITFLKNLDSGESKQNLTTLFPCLIKKMSDMENFEKEKTLAKLDSKEKPIKKEEVSLSLVKGFPVLDSKESFKLLTDKSPDSYQAMLKYAQEIQGKFSTYMKKIRKSKKDDMKVNEITEESPSLMQEIVEKNILHQKQLSRNELVFNSFLLLFAITRKVKLKETSDKLDLIIDLLKFMKRLYSFRKFVNIFIILYYKIIEQKKGVNAEKERLALRKMVGLITETNLIPNEELLLYLDNSIGKKFIDVNDLTPKMEGTPMTTDATPGNFFEKYAEMNQNDKMQSPSTPSLEEDLQSQLSKTLQRESVMPGSKTNPPKNFLQFNLASDGQRKYADYFITLSDNILYEGDLYLQGGSSKHFLLSSSNNPMQPESQPMPTKKMTNKTIWTVGITQLYCCYTFLFSPLKLYNLCVDMLNNAIRADVYQPNYEKLKNIACNLIFYIENVPGLLNVSHKKEKESDNDPAILAIKTSMLDFLYSILTNIPQEELEVQKYINQKDFNKHTH